MKVLTTILGRLMLGVTACMWAAAAWATPLTTDTAMDPAIVSGNWDGMEPPFTGAPAPLPYDQFTGVVSIFIDYGDLGGFICTGSVIGQRHILTAAHCVDETGTGQAIDLSNPDYQILAVFNNDEPYFLNPSDSLRSAAAVTIHPDYHGFGICGPGDNPGFSGQCLNDDLAVIELDQDIPAGVEIYGFDLSPNPVNSGTLLTMVGHGLSGDGYFGYYIGADFAEKRMGFNLTEIFDCDDEAAFIPGGWADTSPCGLQGAAAEVWYADFDGYDWFSDAFDVPPYEDGNIDAFCVFFGLGCGTGLGDGFEANLGGGDSGGPSFIYDFTTGKWLLAANNTFGSNGFWGPGAFGAFLGGNIYKPYHDWIDYNFVDVPEPASLGLLGLGLAMIGFARRRRNA